MGPNEGDRLKEDMLILPELVIQDRGEIPEQVLRPVFDRVWNAFGFVGSFHCDNENNRVGR